MTGPKKQDWQKIIAELGAHRITMHKIATLLGVQYKTVNDWALGKFEPRHHQGEFMLALHAEYVPRETLPE